MSAFRMLNDKSGSNLVDNFRPVQNLNGRIVQYMTPSSETGDSSPEHSSTGSGSSTTSSKTGGHGGHGAPNINQLPACPADTGGGHGGKSDGHGSEAKPDGECIPPDQGDFTFQHEHMKF